MSYQAYSSFQADANNSMNSANQFGGGFGGGAGGAGGGFMKGGGAGGGAFGGFSASQGGAGDSPSGKRPRKAQSLTSVCVRQLLGAQEQGGQAVINGRPVGTVTFVGRVVGTESQPTSVSYTIDDGSGALAVQRFLNSQGSGEPNIEECAYVRVVGGFSLFQGKPQVNVFDVTPVADFNEVTYHMLDVIHTHLQATRGAAAPAAGAAAAPAAGLAGPTIGGGAAAGDAAADPGGLAPLQREVMNVFEANDSETGATVALVVSQIPHASEAEIRQAIEFLSNEGHLYSTIDEDHFKSTSV